MVATKAWCINHGNVRESTGTVRHLVYYLSALLISNRSRDDVTPESSLAANGTAPDRSGAAYVQLTGWVLLVLRVAFTSLGSLASGWDHLEAMSLGLAHTHQ